jgi:hypothetical protein
MKTHPTNIGKGIEKQIDTKKPENEWKGVKYGVETLYDEIPQRHRNRIPAWLFFRQCGTICIRDTE